MRRKYLLYLTIFSLTTIGMAGYHLGYYSIEKKPLETEVTQSMEEAIEAESPQVLGEDILIQP